MNRENIAEEVLNILGNTHTKVKFIHDNGFNYYNYMSDTIYLTDKDSKKNKKGLDNANPFCGYLTMICHECIHSTQNKKLHITNFVLSNICILLLLLTIIVMIVSSKPIWYIILTTSIIMFSIIVRVKLELEAIIKSVPLMEKIRDELKITEISLEDISKAKMYIKRLLPLQIIQMILDKIIIFVIVVI